MQVQRADPCHKSKHSFSTPIFYIKYCFKNLPGCCFNFYAFERAFIFKGHSIIEVPFAGGNTEYLLFHVCLFVCSFRGDLSMGHLFLRVLHSG